MGNAQILIVEDDKRKKMIEQCVLACRSKMYDAVLNRESRQPHKGC
jgi:hypothetical protein